MPCRGRCFPSRTVTQPSAVLPGRGTELADVLDELFTLPFFSQRRLVIVEDADTFVTKHRKELEAYVEGPSGSGILLFRIEAMDLRPQYLRRPSTRSASPSTARVCATRTPAKSFRGSPGTPAVGATPSSTRTPGISSWTSWALRSGSWQPRWKSWRFTLVIRAGSTAGTSPRWWEPDVSRRSGRRWTRRQPDRGARLWNCSTISWRPVRFRRSCWRQWALAAEGHTRRPAPGRAIEPRRGLPGLPAFRTGLGKDREAARPPRPTPGDQLPSTLLRADLDLKGGNALRATRRPPSYSWSGCPCPEPTKRVLSHVGSRPMNKAGCR